jgi:septal ring factor EnvC (AmiA/AmiB activator)
MIDQQIDEVQRLTNDHRDEVQKLQDDIKNQAEKNASIEEESKAKAD